MEESRNEPVAPGAARRYRRGDTCPICLDPPQHPTGVDPCWHVFCRVCIQRWDATAAAATCPLCRGPIMATRPLQVEDDRAGLLRRHGARLHPHMGWHQGHQQQQRDPGAPLRRSSSAERAEPSAPAPRQRVRSRSEQRDSDGCRRLRDPPEIRQEWSQRFWEVALGSGDHAHRLSWYRF